MNKKSFYIQLENTPEDKISPLSDEEIKIRLENNQPIPGLWRQLLVRGEWGKHPRYGTIRFTSQNLNEIYENIKNNTIGRQLSFNYDHDGKSPAVSTIIDVKKILNSNGEIEKLEYLPEYTPTGYKLIRGKEYKYGSIEYEDDYNGKGMALTNAAATNDPFLTGEGITQLGYPSEEKKHRPFNDIVRNLQDIHDELKQHPDLYRKQGSPQLRSLFSLALKNISSALPNDTHLENSEEAKNLNKDEKEAKIMPTEMEKKLQALEDKIVKLEAEKTETKKELSKEPSDEVKKLQADNAKLIQEVGKSKLEVWETKMLSKGHMKPAIEKVKEEAVKAGYSTTIKLSNDNNVDLLDYSEKLLDLACPEEARVNLSQEPDSGTWIKLDSGKDNKENPLVADAKARKERGR
jgi:phage I-like protein